MEQKVIMYSAVCSFTPHSRDAIEAIPHLYVSEWIRPMLVWKQLSLTHAGLEKLILDGIEFGSLINVWNQEVFFCHFMLYLNSTHHATLVPNCTGFFSSCSAAGTNVCFDLCCCRCLQSGDKNLLYWRCSGF